MKKPFLRITLLAVGFGVFVSSSSWAALVTWDLNPGNLNASAGSSSLNYTVSGATITARGFDNTGSTPAPLDLFYKMVGPINGAVERGLGVVGTYDNELETKSNGTPAQFIQLDLRSILAQGFMGGQLSVGSVQAGESFLLFGSNTRGTLGSQIGTAFGNGFDDNFVDIANFGSFQFISVAAGTGDVLPVEFRALAPVPEMNALLPIVGLIVAVGWTQILRRRRSAQLSA